MADEATASQHCTTFALKVFAKADNEDRQPGGSNKVTARNFVVSTQFMQVLAGFGELSEEIKEKIKYAKWRAAEILKAIREGREPVGPPKDVEEGNELKPGDVGAWPSPPSDSQRNSADVMSPSPSIAQQQQQQQQVSASASPQWSTGTAYPNANPLGGNSHGGGSGGVARAFDDAVLPTVPKSNVYGEGALQSPGFHSQPQQQHQAGRSSSAVPQISTPVSAAAFIPVPASNLPALTGPDGELLLDPTDAKNAQKFSRWAISALEYDDVDTAIENLQKAIQILLPYRK
ncbi:hypothetical protein LPJ56_001051 [Coemansia sp. RSA 2599]|nr:hypothetical protein LPJ56_001051 [Coemansia sp. RSA 2599]